MPGRLGQGPAPGGSVRVSTEGTGGGPAVHDAVGDDGLPGTEGQGDAPGGSDTMSAPPGPVISRSWPQMAPGEEGCLPGTSSQVEEDDPACTTPIFAGAKPQAVAAAMAIAAPAIVKRDLIASRMLVC